MPLVAGLLAVRTVYGADSAPADKQALLKQQAIYLSFEITEADTTAFGTGAKDALTDGAHRYTKTAKFEIPLNMPMPDTCPPSSTSMSAAMEQGRCIGWMAAPPDDAAVEEALMTGTVDMAKNPMFLPVEFSIDDVHQFRYRDSPSAGFATETTISKGCGIAYMMLSGMMLCDVKSLVCDLNNALTGYQDGTDLVTVTKTSDVPGFEATKETVGPARLLPTVPKDMLKQLLGFTITLPEPITKVFKGPATTGDASPGGATVTVKLTLSAKAAAKAAAGAVGTSTRSAVTD